MNELNEFIDLQDYNEPPAPMGVQPAWIQRSEVAQKKAQKKAQKLIDGKIADHKIWLDTNGDSGTQFVLKNFTCANISFRNADLRNATFAVCYLIFPKFKKANLDGASFMNCKFCHPSFDQITAVNSLNITRSDVNSADFSGAVVGTFNGIGSDFGGCNFNKMTTQTVKIATSIGSVCSPGFIQCIQTGKIDVSISIKHQQISLSAIQYTFDELFLMTDNEFKVKIAHTLHGRFSKLDWWKTWKPILKAIIAAGE